MFFRASRLRQLIIVSTVLGIIFLINTANFKNDAEPTTLKDFNIVVSGHDGVEDGKLGGSANIDKTIDARKKSLLQQTCRVPKLDINGTEVRGFFHTPQPLPCGKSAKNWVFIDDNGDLQISSDRKSANCKITYFLRKNGGENTYLAPVEVVFGKPMKYDFGKVFCTDAASGRKWSNLLMSAAKIDVVEERLKKSFEKDNEKTNVFILVFDSLSQLSFRRKLPKTVEYLEKVLGSTVLNGYNIVGDGTPQAIIPILTASTEVELPLTRKRYREANYVDDVYPFIWNNFSSEGYATIYGEDAFNIGTFTYRLKGFRKQPTDHYLTPFFKDYEAKGGGHCLGSEPLHKSWFSYAKQFMKIYKPYPRFLLMHQSLLSHDDINLVQVEDDDLYKFLKNMNEEGYFDDSMVIIMADHGHRFAKLRETQQGQLEERLPFVSVSLPAKMRETTVGKQMQENLIRNKEKLSTPFDLHATLMDILYTPILSDLTSVQSGKERSLSLFRPIPESRTCDTAGIEPHWCTCLNWVDALKTSEDKEVSYKLANHVVSAINGELANVTELCAPLKLKELIYAKKLIPNDDLLKYKNVKDTDGFVPDLSGNTKAVFAHYQLKFSTSPGRAVYEITLFYDTLVNNLYLDLSAISHVSKYGDDPHCIIDKNYFLATYCVCYDRV
ncbi:unnamed protein product [Auanema sp. JU1783]|nr:unnamed protein product [Auanema sp. JU1783]